MLLETLRGLGLDGVIVLVRVELVVGMAVTVHGDMGDQRVVAGAVDIELGARIGVLAVAVRHLGIGGNLAEGHVDVGAVLESTDGLRVTVGYADIVCSLGRVDLAQVGKVVAAVDSNVVRTIRIARSGEGIGSVFRKRISVIEAMALIYLAIRHGDVELRGNGCILRCRERIRAVDRAVARDRLRVRGVCRRGCERGTEATETLRHHEYGAYRKRCDAPSKLPDPVEHASSFLLLVVCFVHVLHHSFPFPAATLAAYSRGSI